MSIPNKLSRADKNKHKGIEFSRRFIADSIKDALTKFVQKGFASPFEFKQVEDALAAAPDMKALKELKNKFMADITTVSAKNQLDPFDILEGAAKNLLEEPEDYTLNDPDVQKLLGEITPAKNQPPSGSPEKAQIVIPEGKRGTKKKSKRVTDEMLTEAPKEPKNKLAEEPKDNIESEEDKPVTPKKPKLANIEGLVSFLDDDKQLPMKTRLRQMLKVPERVTYYNNLCTNCCERTKLYGEELCSQCKRAEASRGLSELRRQQRSKQRAVDFKEKQMIQRAAILGKTREMEKKNKDLDADLLRLC